MASPKPAVIIRREFETQPDAVAQDLRACIIGPACQLVRFAEASEQAKGLLASLDTLSAPGANLYLLSADTAYEFPNLVSTSVLDTSYIKVFAKNALLTYGQTTASINGSPTANNVIQFSGGSNVWRTENGGTLASGLVQDVEIGDVVSVYTGSTPFSLYKESVVTGFVPNTVAASVSSVTASITAPVTETASVSNVVIGGVTFAISVSAYMDASGNQGADPRRVGQTSTTYTIKIIGGSGSTPIVSLTSSTGLDNVASQTVNGTPTDIGVSGLQISVASGTVSSVGASGTFSVDVGHTSASMSPTSVSGTYTGTQNTTYYLTCIQGGSLKTGVIFKISTNNGADVISTVTVTTSSSTTQVVTVGSYGLSVTFPVTNGTSTSFTQGFKKGDVLYFTATAAAETGAVQTVVLADSLGTSYPTITKVRVAKRKTIEIPQYDPQGADMNWEVTDAADPVARRLELKREIVVRDASLTDSATTDLYVTAGDLYVQYRAYLAVPREVGSVVTLDDISSQLGTIHPDNLLAYGVYKAWQNANGQTIHFVPVLSTDLNGTRGFADAISLVTGNRNCYSLVPLTTDAEIWGAFAGHVASESDPAKGRFRILWVAPEVAAHSVVLDKDDNGLTLEGVQTGSGTNTAFAVKAGLFTTFTDTVREGDWVRTNFEPDPNGTETYDEFQVVSVDSNTQLTISTAGATIGVNARFEIVRDLTSNELATAYVASAGGFSSERIFAVVPDRGVNGLRVGGTPVKNFYVACAFAGLRSGSRPHQPLSNVELLGFDGSNATVPAFDETDLDTLRDGGVWVVRNTEDGKIYSERQLSTSTLDIYRKEQSVTTNLDSMAFLMHDGLEDLVGRVNITQASIGRVRAAMVSILSGLTATYGAVGLGPQLISYTIGDITVAPTAQDTLLTKIEVEVPVPMNTIDATLVVTV